MQFTTIVATLIAATLATAIPAPPQLKHKLVKNGLLSTIEGGIGSIENATIGSCEITKCATALAPAVVGCGAAAAQAFVDPISDIACLAAAVNDGVNLPSECDNCDPANLK